MSYAPGYTASDLAPIAVDTIASIAAVAVSLATLVGLVLIYVWAKKKF
jgi:hypothetical protein